MRKYLLYIYLGAIVFNCGGGSDDPEPTPTPKNPEAASLVYPEQNSECTTGTNVTATNSTVEFEWDTSTNTDTYELTLKNLVTTDETKHTSSTNKISLELLKATPYSWYIISKSNSVTNTAQSQTWKFYNAGDGVISYAPFPAEVIAPVNDANIATTDKVTLDWNGSDVDNDIAAYDVYFGTTASPPSFKTNQLESLLEDVSVTSATTYYWYIITKDEQGNNSQSETFKFTIN
ncbi:hypothetical protein [Flavivirga spongiicola]|uniref:Fibronectin type-III domain-containing protein n=1 Tax=Flavivirga spongiicola TaxID=421621 RepID=A0ABU7XXH2_9FLAO|nr:hypothetical protein [Flavivirga sp. MEBiC05379]MDO5980233.1 hypothetical protein [Flavivirga sp. MEBiC05379]